YNTLKHVLNIISAKTGETIINSMISGIMFTLKSFWIIIFIPILIFMMMKDYSLFYNKLSKFLIKHKRSEWIQLLKNIDKKLGAYIRGQIIVMAYMFVGTLIFLLILGMPNALVFAIIVAFTNIIPYIGPYIGGFPLWIYALFQSPYLFVGSIIVIFIMQQLDGNIGQPIVFGTQLKIHPLMILAIMLTGLSLNGIIGLLISIPVYIILSETFIFFKPKLKELHNKKPISE
ncbi:MAG TPA: AI-2E family transporter, partial [Haloplasmataceae bacterium]